MMADWMDALDQFSEKEISRACSEWLAGKSTKPKPADIRGSMVEFRKRYREKVETPEDRAVKDIKSGKTYLCTSISRTLVRHLIDAGKVTPEEVRKVGL